MRRLIRLFIDAVSGNSAAFPRRLQELGVRYPREREEDLRADLEALWQRYAGASLADVDPNELLRDLLGVIHRHRLQLPTRFLLLDRALITLGSVGQELYPAFNVFELARPYAEELTPRAVLAGGDLRPGPAGGRRLDPGDARPAARRRGAGRGADRAATSRSRSTSPRWTSRSAASMRRRTGSSWPSC